MEMMESKIIKKHRIYKKDAVKPTVVQNHLSDYEVRLIALYDKELNSGYDGRTKICNYQGLIELAMSYYKPHCDIVALRKVLERNRTSDQKKCLAAYGYLILTNNVQSW